MAEITRVRAGEKHAQTRGVVEGYGPCIHPQAQRTVGS